MTYAEIRQQLKNESLNKIIHIHSKYFKYEGGDDLDDDFYGDCHQTSCSDERDRAVKRELDRLEYKLKELKDKKEYELRRNAKRIKELNI